jgi:hypothetical protein
MLLFHLKKKIYIDGNKVNSISKNSKNQKSNENKKAKE